MQDFFVYTPDLLPLGILEGWDTITWQRSYATPGKFSIQLPILSDVAMHLQPENLIVHGAEAGIIEAVSVAYEDDLGDVIIVDGRLLAAYLDRRIIWGKQDYAGDAAAAMRAMVAANALSGDRAIPHLSVPGGMTSGTTIAATYENVALLKTLEALAAEQGLGFCIDFTPNGLAFRVYAGVDRSAGQTANTRAIFSRRAENIISQEYDSDSTKQRTVARVSYTKDDAETVVQVGSSTGRARRELAVKASRVDKDEDGNTLTSSQTQALMAQQGAEKLAKYPLQVGFTATVDPNGNLVYGSHYDLGDIVTVEAPEWRLAVDVRITAITEIYENAGCTLQIQLGDNVADLQQIILGVMANG